MYFQRPWRSANIPECEWCTRSARPAWGGTEEGVEEGDAVSTGVGGARAPCQMSTKVAYQSCSPTSASVEAPGVIVDGQRTIIGTR